MQSKVNNLSNRVINTEKDAEKALENYQEVSTELSTVSEDLEIVAGVVTENARNIATNASNISENTKAIADILIRLEALENT
jgi:hypothetical protein